MKMLDQIFILLQTEKGTDVNRVVKEKQGTQDGTDHSDVREPEMRRKEEVTRNRTRNDKHTNRR